MKRICPCMMYHRKNLVTFIWIRIRYSLAFICLIHTYVVWLVIVCLSVCHSDRYACRHSSIHYIHGRTQLILKLTLSFTYLCQCSMNGCLTHTGKIIRPLCVVAEFKSGVFRAVVEMLRWFAGDQIRNVAVRQRQCVHTASKSPARNACVKVWEAIHEKSRGIHFG